MVNSNFSPVNHPKQVPDHVTDNETADFWDSHEITDDFLEKSRPLDQSEMSDKRTEAKPITVRMDLDTLERLQELAKKKHKGYQSQRRSFLPLQNI